MTVASVAFSLLLTLQLAAQASTATDGFSITLERIGCLGSCPDYTVTIHGDGTVRYEGVAYVQTKGVRTRTIPTSAVQKLIQTLRKEGFFEWEEEKKVCIDFPEVHITASLKGKQKHVLEGCNSPGQVLKLAEEIDRLSRANGWVGRVR